MTAERQLYYALVNFLKERKLTLSQNPLADLIIPVESGDTPIGGDVLIFPVILLREGI